MAKFVMVLIAVLILSNVLWMFLYKHLHKRYIDLDNECADMNATMMAMEAEYQLAKAQLQRQEEAREKADAIKSGDDAVSILSKPSKKKSETNA